MMVRQILSSLVGIFMAYTSLPIEYSQTVLFSLNFYVFPFQVTNTTNMKIVSKWDDAEIKRGLGRQARARRLRVVIYTMEVQFSSSANFEQDFGRLFIDGGKNECGIGIAQIGRAFYSHLCTFCLQTANFLGANGN
jgi:hypothetical protein